MRLAAIQSDGGLAIDKLISADDSNRRIIGRAKVEDEPFGHAVVSSDADDAAGIVNERRSLQLPG